MSTSIYYFTGTGNSLHAARAIAGQLGESSVVGIARQAGPGIVEDKSDTVGIVFPVFYMDAPNIVKDFAARLKVAPEAYVFAVATCGGMSGNAHHSVDRNLAKNGGRLSAGFTLVMPDNAYIGMNLVTPPEEREEALKASESELNKIIDALKKREVQEQKFGYSISGGLMGFGGSAFATHLYRLPRRFRATDKCNGCGICKKICPVGNITQADKKVTWDNKCTHCLACFHWCPQAAIEIGNRSAGIARYHHPAVKVSDLIK